jgi:GAF domain-containing protein
MIGASSMNIPESHLSNNDRLLARLGSRYIQLAVGRSQLASLLVGPPIGLLFTFVTAKLSSVQAIKFVIILAIFIALANILPPFFTHRGTRQATARLNNIFKGQPLPEGNDPFSAWKEIITLPGRMAISQLSSAFLLVTIPVVLCMRIIGGASWFQVAAIAVGGSLAVMAMLIQSILNMDNRLAPVRRALLPENATQQEVHLSVGSATRHYFILGFLILSALLTTGVLVYGKFSEAALPGANIPGILNQLLIQLGIFGVLFFGLGLFLASRLFQANTRPVQEMSRAIRELQKGDLSQRADITTSDETAYLTIHVNQLLDQFQKSHTGLEKQIIERTRELDRKTSFLQAAAWIAHEASGLQDINTLLNRVVELISTRFGYYHTGIFLLDDSEENVILQAASSEDGRRLLARGYKLAVGSEGIIGTSAYQNRAQVVSDVNNIENYHKQSDLSPTRSEVAIPLSARGRVLGVLDIHSTEPTAFSQDEIDLLQAMADQIGLAIQNAHLTTENQRILQQLETTTASNIQKTWRERLRSSKHAYRYAAMGLTTVTQLGNIPAVSSNDPNHLNIPIILRGQQLGTMILRRSSDEAWGDTDRSLAIEIATQIGLALENARLLEDAQRRAAQESSLSELASKLSRSLDPDVLLQTAIRELHQLPNVSGVSVYLAPSEKSTSNDIK